MGTETDDALISRCQKGDTSAFRLLLMRYQRPLYNAAYRVVGNVEDARDVTQLAFFEAARRLPDFDRSHRFFSWIYRITLNAALNLVRGNRRKEAVAVASSEPAAPVDPESQLARSETSARIQRALMQLTDEYRTVLTLRHFAGCSYREIAEIVGVEEKTVKSRLFEARQRMRAALGDAEAG